MDIEVVDLATTGSQRRRRRRREESLEGIEDIIEYAIESGSISSTATPPLPLSPEPLIIRGTGSFTVFGLSNHFPTKFPPSLLARVAPEEFEGTIERVNSLVKNSVPLQLKWAVVGFLCCCCTMGCSLWPPISMSKRTKSSIEKLLHWENSHLYNKLGLRWKLAKIHLDSSSLLEYVLLIEFLEKEHIYKPD